MTEIGQITSDPEQRLGVLIASGEYYASRSILTVTTPFSLSSHESPLAVVKYSGSPEAVLLAGPNTREPLSPNRYTVLQGLYGVPSQILEFLATNQRIEQAWIRDTTLQMMLRFPEVFEMYYGSDTQRVHANNRAHIWERDVIPQAQVAMAQGYDQEAFYIPTRDAPDVWGGGS